MAWGRLLQGQFISCDADVLDSELDVEILLRKVVEAAGMVSATEPLIFREVARDVGKGPGVTGLMGLTESHVAVHTYPGRGRMFLTLLSCAPFDGETIMEAAARYVHSDDWSHQEIWVGEDWAEKKRPLELWGYKWNEEAQAMVRIKRAE